VGESWWVAQGVECISSKHEALSSNPNTARTSTKIAWGCYPSHTFRKSNSLGDVFVGFFVALGFEHSTTWAIPPTLFALVYFSDRVSCFSSSASLRPRSSHLCLPLNWD
jgi:hypothetical protein